MAAHLYSVAETVRGVVDSPNDCHQSQFQSEHAPDISVEIRVLRTLIPAPQYPRLRRTHYQLTQIRIIAETFPSRACLVWKACLCPILKGDSMNETLAAKVLLQRRWFQLRLRTLLVLGHTLKHSNSTFNFYPIAF